MPQTNEIRACMLKVIADRQPGSPGEGNLQSRIILGATLERLGGDRKHALEEAILTVFHDLLRTGYLAWGFNLSNPNPPFFHITEKGRRSLANLSRDPSNPDGYFNFLSTVSNLNPIADSYLREAIDCFVQDLPKAAAVMVGGASESMALELRDAIIDHFKSLNLELPKGINDWRFKVVLDSMHSFFDQNTGQMSRELSDSFQSYWSAFLQQIRSVRNDASHPSSVTPITFDAVHASLLIFPELAKLTAHLLYWVSHDYKWRKNIEQTLPSSTSEVTCT